MKSYEEYTWWDYIRISLKHTNPERVKFCEERKDTPNLFLFDLEGFEIEVMLNKDMSLAVTEAVDDFGAELPLTVGQIGHIIELTYDKIIEF